MIFISLTIFISFLWKEKENGSLAIKKVKIIKKNYKKLRSFQVHPYHLVEPSPWPLGASVALLILTLGGSMKFHGFHKGDILLPLGVLLVILTMIFWWRDQIREATYRGHHTKLVKQGLTIGVILFIISELFLFLSFFWAFFHSSLSPAVTLGWPPVGITPLNPISIPLLNTIILLTSGATLTVSHNKIISGDRILSIKYLILTIYLAFFFLALQFMEYTTAPFTIADSVYGSTFFLLTGTHGLHVIVGSIFLIISLDRINNYHFTKHHHLGYEAAIWYWHMVDVVWIFLFITVYWWGSAPPLNQQEYFRFIIIFIFLIMVIL